MDRRAEFVADVIALINGESFFLATAENRTIYVFFGPKLDFAKLNGKF
jgi:hypothetical protein